MLPRALCRMLPALLVLFLLSLPGAYAQSDTAKRPIGPDDYGKWESLAFSTVISTDGQWLAYTINRVNEENELRIASLTRDTTFVVPHGSDASFTKNGRWIAYAIGVGPAEQRRLEKQKKPIRSDLGLRNLVSGDTLVIEEIAGFTFSDDGAYLAMRRYTPEDAGDRTHDGVNLVVRDLATGVETSFGNVSSFAWQDDGTLLAMILDAEGQAGNGVQLYDPVSGRLRTLDSKTTRYSTLTWREEDDDLAVLRVRGDDERYEDSTHVVLAWRDLAGRRPTSFTFDPDSAAGFPADMRIVPFAGLRWADDGSILYFGIQERKLAPDTAEAAADSTVADTANDDEEPSTVQIWHARDVRLFPLQKFQARQDREKSFLSAWHVDAGRFVQLGTALVRDVRVVEGDRYAFGTDPSPYEEEGMFGPRLQDLYLINVATGAATLLRERVQYSYGPSSGGRYLLYLLDDHYWTYDLRTGRHTNITEGLPTSFVDLKARDVWARKPPFGVVGWTRDDRSVLVNDEYDVWELRPDGSRPARVTDGAGDRVRHRHVRLDPDEEYIDTSRPLYFTLYGERTKWYGYGRLANGRLERLVWEEANVGRLSKAEGAEVYLYVTQRFDDSPDYFVSGPDLHDARQVSTTNPFQSQYLWGHAELIEYQNTWGEDLQGALFYPAGYEPGKQYPMIVYIYEIRSPSVHGYTVPSNRSAYNTTVWTSQGYFVLQPDIVYRAGDAGHSAVEAVVPAVETVLETGMVDPARVGLIGGSWGGYETTFIVTQTDIFAAAVALAPLTDLVSMYLSVMWNFGDPNAQVFETTRLFRWVPFWEDLDAYIANSPVFQVQNLNTPLLVAHGDEDGNVDFNQGVELYNAARRAGKDFVLLVYEGENHGNRQKANQIDFHNRTLEWFGHYLKGDPAPTWIVAGVSYLDQEEANKRRGRIN